MTTAGIEAVFLETHSWGKAARFFQALGYELEFETDHSSGQFRNGVGPPVFIAEVPPDHQPEVRIVFRVPDADEDTHWGTREVVVRDPDGRLWTLPAPGRG